MEQPKEQSFQLVTMRSAMQASSPSDLKGNQGQIGSISQAEGLSLSCHSPGPGEKILKDVSPFCVRFSDNSFLKTRCL